MQVDRHHGSVEPTASTFMVGQSSTLKMEAMETSKVFVAIYQTVQCYNLKDHNTKCHDYVNHRTNH